MSSSLLCCCCRSICCCCCRSCTPLQVRITAVVTAWLRQLVLRAVHDLMSVPAMVHPRADASAVCFTCLPLLRSVSLFNTAAKVHRVIKLFTHRSHSCIHHRLGPAWLVARKSRRWGTCHHTSHRAAQWLHAGRTAQAMYRG